MYTVEEQAARLARWKLTHPNGGPVMNMAYLAALPHHATASQSKRVK
jgi:hypothetical protein